MPNRAKHAFGNSNAIEAAKQANKIDAFDILFLDGDTDPKVGWIDRDGNTVICEDKKQVVRVEELPTIDGDESVVYLFENKGYVWDILQQKCVPMAESVDVSELTGKVNILEEQVAEKINAEDVDSKINKAMSDVKKYEIAYKPSGTLVDYGEREIRVLCPSDTQWTLQQSGAGADTNSYYIGFKAYAPSDDVVSFKEDLAEIIRDDTMYYFVDNEFAGIDEYGRKYSIVWLPVAKYDEASDTWTYHGSKSSGDRYIGWYYNVEWYNANGVAIASDCIRINLSNEDCHSLVKPFYISNAISAANTYTDEQIAAAISVIEF